MPVLVFIGFMWLKAYKTKSFKFNYTVPPLIKMYAEAESIGFNCLTKDAIWCRDKIIKHLSTEYEVNKFNSNGTDLSFSDFHDIRK